MMAMRGAKTRERLLRGTRALMLAKGYPATTVDQICAEAGLTKGSFYHFFRTKEEIALAALAEYYQEVQDRLMTGPFARLGDGAARARGFLQHGEAVAEEVWGSGCLLGTFALDLAETNPKIGAQVSDLFAELTRGLAGLLEPLRNGDAPPASDLAEQYLAVVEGSIILAKAHNDPRKISQGLRIFRRYLESLAG
jgi:TetR/AcrR family transcriptional repressor of nem operon